LIINRIDDSVIKIIDNNYLFLRRSRGFVPAPIIVDDKLSCDKVILALGAEMANTICVFIDGKIYQSQYLGNISNADAYENYKKTVNSFLKLLKAKPNIVLCDLHPTYNSTRFAKEYSKQNNVPLEQIQHHVAHAYSVAIENNLKEFIAITCDGLGYGVESNNIDGNDAKIWGGEVFHNDKRIGHLDEFEQIGGDLANIDPSRLLFSIMKKVFDDDNNDEFKCFMLKYIDKTKFDMLNKQLFSNINCPITSSTGRLFDAVSFMLGFCDSRTYECRGAMLLEANSTKPYDIEPSVKDDVLQIGPLFKFIFDGLANKKNSKYSDKKRLAATAQLYVAKGLLLIAKDYSKKNKLKLPVLFSGGCAYNKIMTSYLLSKGVLINKETAAGDGGISVGQIGYYLISKNTLK
jgi:hydrogenase maturation protein HypF